MNFYQHADLAAAENMIQLHLAKLQKARQANDYPGACAALRAIQSETQNASQIATSLSLNAHLQARMPRSKQ